MRTDIVQISLPQETYPLSNIRKTQLITQLSEIYGCSKNEIQVYIPQEESTWLGLEMPEDVAKNLIRFFNNNRQALTPLFSQFHVDTISQLRLSHSLQLKPEYTLLIKLLYLGQQNVLVEQELNGGFGGALILLIQPINQQGKSKSRQILKIGLAVELEQEKHNTGKVIDDLPFITPRLVNCVVRESLMGLTYHFVSDGVLGKTQTLETYYHTATIDQFKETLTSLLYNSLGQKWYSQAKPLTTSFAEEYGRHLVEYLRLKINYLSKQEGIWPARTHLEANSNYLPVTNKQIDAITGIKSGTLVQISGLRLSKIRGGVLKLEALNNQSIVVKIEVGNILPSVKVGDEVVVQGEVIYNRHQHMEKIVEEIFAEFPSGSVNVKDEWLTFGTDKTYPNPLYLYPKILGQTLSGQQSTVHGDLHLRNVLVDETGRGYLIDFAKVTERHNLFDFIKLETYIRQWILGDKRCEFSFEDYLTFEETLVAATLGEDATLPENRHLQKAYEVILHIRQIAACYIGSHSSFKEEYLPALFLYNLAMLKYWDSHGVKTGWLAFGLGGVIAKTISPSKPIIPPPPENPGGENTPNEETPLPQPIKIQFLDIYASLERGLEKLQKAMGQDHPDYADFTASEQRLKDNIKRSRRFGDTQNRQAERVEIIEQLNRIARSTLNITFNSLCQ